MFRTGGNAITNSVLSIWRERSSEPGTYDRIMRIELGRCGGEIQAPSVMGMSDVYECTLPQGSERALVQPGDIVGIELSSASRALFRLYFDNTTSGPANYVFNSHGYIFSLSQASSTPQDQPQISLTVVPDMPIATVSVFPTTQHLANGPVTTEILDGSGSSQQSASADLGLIIGSVVGGVVGIILLSAVIVLTLALVYQSRKYRRDGVIKDRETRIATTQNVKVNDAQDVEVKANLSYNVIPVFCQISTESNVAYGERVNQDSCNGLYESIAPPS